MTQILRGSKKWDSFRDNFIEEYFVLHPDFAVYSGRHEFDGKLPDWSPSGLAKQGTWLHEKRTAALGFGDGALDEDRKFERDYLVSVIERDLFWLEAAEFPFRNPTYYTLDPNVYIARPYAPVATRMRAYTLYAQAIPRAAKQIKENLRTPLPSTFLDIGRITFGGLASYYEHDVPTAFEEVKDKAIQSEFQAANSEAIKAMKELDAWLAKQTPAAAGSFALGPKLFAEMLHATEQVDTPLEELQRIGKADLDRNISALRKACADYAPGKSVEQCLQIIRSKKPLAGPIEAARNQLANLKKFLGQNALVSIPGTEEAEVQESPPYQRWNLAYIDIPGPYEKGLPSVYYIAPPDPSWTPQEREEYIPGEADLLFTSIHEVWPGHFLQFLHSNRNRSRFGKIFVGYAFAEGWAHYAEEMMWEAGFGSGNAEIHIGQLLNALLRNVRFLSAIGLHTGTMSVEQSEHMFCEQGFQDAGTAKQQSARGTFDPAYLNYTMGKLMIQKLRQDWTSTRGGRSAWREFHDMFLSLGGPPIPLVRKAMLGSDKGPVF